MDRPAPPADAVIDAWIGLVEAQQSVLGAVEADLKRAGFPPLAWYDALLELRRAGPAGLRPFALEAAMLLAQYNLSRLVDRLEAAGHLTRAPCEEDRRGHVLRITEAGRALLARMWPAYAAAIQRHLGERLTPAEAACLAGLLGRLRSGVSAAAPPSAPADPPAAARRPPPAAAR